MFYRLAGWKAKEEDSDSPVDGGAERDNIIAGGVVEPTRDLPPSPRSTGDVRERGVYSRGSSGSQQQQQQHPYGMSEAPTMYVGGGGMEGLAYTKQPRYPPQQPPPYYPEPSSRVVVPVGHWKDGLLDIFRFGPCHTTVWNSCCCTPIATAQVISRLQLTWLGRPSTTTASGSGSFRWWLYLTISYWSIRACLFSIIFLLDPNKDQPDSAKHVEAPPYYFLAAALDDVLAYTFFALVVYILQNVRWYARSKYAIPEMGMCPSGCEDTCCSLVCPCLTVAQLLRHTTDYDTYRAVCCSETGLPPHIPAIV